MKISTCRNYDTREGITVEGYFTTILVLFPNDINKIETKQYGTLECVRVYISHVYHLHLIGYLEVRACGGIEVPPFELESNFLAAAMSKEVSHMGNSFWRISRFLESQASSISFRDAQLQIQKVKKDEQHAVGSRRHRQSLISGVLKAKKLTSTRFSNIAKH